MLIQQSKAELVSILKALNYSIVADESDSMLLKSQTKTYLLIANPILNNWTICDKGTKLVTFDLKETYTKEEIQKHLIDIK